MSKFIYLTSSEFGSVASHDFDETFDFETEPHEMRLHEIVYNQDEKLKIYPERLRLLYLIPSDKEGEKTMAEICRNIVNKAHSEGRHASQIMNLPGYEFAMYEEVGRKKPTGFTTEFFDDYGRGKSFPMTRHDSLKELVEIINHLLLEVSPIWNLGDSAPRLTFTKDRIRITPGVLQQPHRRNIYVLPSFGPQILRVLSLPELHIPLMQAFTRGEITSVVGKEVVMDNYIDHFYIIKCNIIQNETQEKDGYGILFSWLKDFTRSSQITHIKNESKCWVPVTKSKVHEMQIMILRSDNQLASFNDNYTFAVIEIRPRKWKEVSI